MPQQERIDKVHSGLEGKVTLAEITHRIMASISEEHITNFKEAFRRLEPAVYAYIHTYPDDISDGPYAL